MSKLKRIHVNQHIIRSNHKNNMEDPPLTCKTYNENIKAHEIVLYNDENEEVARVVYKPKDPLSCGARVWIETRLRTEAIIR